MCWICSKVISCFNVFFFFFFLNNWTNKRSSYIFFILDELISFFRTSIPLWGFLLKYSDCSLQKLRISFDLESLSDANTANHAFPSSSSDEEKSGLHTPSSLKRIPTLTTQTLVGPELDAVFNDDDISSFYTSQFHGAEDDQLERVPMVSKGPKCWSKSTITPP